MKTKTTQCHHCTSTFYPFMIESTHLYNEEYRTTNPEQGKIKRYKTICPECKKVHRFTIVERPEIDIYEKTN